MNKSELIIGPAQLTYPAADGGVARCRGGSYEYTADCFDKVAGSFLFWGPYLDLNAGVYVVKFLGEVEGQFSAEFIHDSGRMRIKQITVDDFEMPACVVLQRSVTRFEIRGIKTRAVERLRLDGVRLNCVYRPAGAP